MGIFHPANVRLPEGTVILFTLATHAPLTTYQLLRASRDLVRHLGSDRLPRKETSTQLPRETVESKGQLISDGDEQQILHLM